MSSLPIVAASEETKYLERHPHFDKIVQSPLATEGPRPSESRSASLIPQFRHESLAT